jgi:hypothetical protein
MTELQASRTLVKSPPELWAECSDAASLARHLDSFGEIRITRLEPETAVAWEGERARGTVRIEPAGWGTKVILTAVAEGEETVVLEEPAPPEPTEPEPPMAEALKEPPVEERSVEEPPPPPRKRRFARLRAFWRGEPLAVREPPLEEPLLVGEAPPPPDEAPAPPVQETVVEVRAEPPEAPAPDVSEVRAEPPETPAPDVSETEAALTAALDSLGQAHHRPYSRA